MRRGRPLQIAWQHRASDLYARYCDETNSHRRVRLYALWLVRTGQSLTEASELTGVSNRTMRRWIRCYRENDLEELLIRIPGHAAGDADSYLTLNQEQELRAKIAGGAFHTAQEARRWIEARWRIRYTPKGVYSLFKRLDIAWQTSRRPSVEADLEQQPVG